MYKLPQLVSIWYFFRVLISSVHRTYNERSQSIHYLIVAMLMTSLSFVPQSLTSITLFVVQLSFLTFKYGTQIIILFLLSASINIFLIEFRKLMWFCVSAWCVSKIFGIWPTIRQWLIYLQWDRTVPQTRHNQPMTWSKDGWMGSLDV